MGGGRNWRISRREREVLHLISEGLSDKEIASKLQISYGTVRDYVDKINYKLGSKSRAHAVAIAIRCNVISPENPEKGN